MKKLFCFINICLLIGVTASSQNKKVPSSKSTNDIEQIKKLEYNWVKAEDFLDTVELQKILDKTFISIEANGVSNRQEELLGVNETINRFMKEGVLIDSFHLEDMTINLYDNSAVATYIVITKGKNNGVPFTRKSRFYDVLVKRNGEWKGVASHVIRGLPVETVSYNQIKSRSAFWNAAYNSRDSASFYTLLDSNVILTSGGARQVGLEVCKNICRGLWKMRPDITWNNHQTSIETNEQWGIAFETGNWTESWTEKGDTQKSTIKGKYTIMWKQKNNQWLVSSAIFIPLSCTGSYCNK